MSPLGRDFRIILETNQFLVTVALILSSPTILKYRAFDLLFKEITRSLLLLLTSNHGIQVFFSNPGITNHIMGLLGSAKGADEKTIPTLTLALSHSENLTPKQLAVILGYSLVPYYLQTKIHYIRNREYIANLFKLHSRSVNIDSFSCCSRNVLFSNLPFSLIS